MRKREKTLRQRERKENEIIEEGGELFRSIELQLYAISPVCSLVLSHVIILPPSLPHFLSLLQMKKEREREIKRERERKREKGRKEEMK